jgi:hypothetical protein
VLLPIELRTREIGSRERKTPLEITKGNSINSGLTESNDALFIHQYNYQN